MVLTLLVYAALVATHLGEFWPFSIYPMFSQAGQPWSRTAVVDVSEYGDSEWSEWRSVPVDSLPGTPVALDELGVDPIDLANFISKTRSWDDERVEALNRMFRVENLGERRLLVMRVRGSMDERDSVIVRFEPTVALGGGRTALNPSVPRQ